MKPALIFLPFFLCAACGYGESSGGDALNQAKANGDEKPNQTDDQIVIWCGGGSVSFTAVAAYFDKVEAALSNPATDFRPFFDKRICVDNGKNRVCYETAKLGKQQARNLVPQSVWKKMIAINAAGLNEAGYRGCFMGNGQMSFQADGTSFGLSDVDLMRSWE